MELKEIAIIFINAIAIALGYVAIVNRILPIFSQKRIDNKKLYAVILTVVFCISFSEIISYEPVILGAVSIVFLFINKIPILQNLLISVVSAVIFVMIMITQTAILAFIIDIPIEKALVLRQTIFYNIYNSVMYILLSLIFVYVISLIFRKIPSIRNMANTESGSGGKKNIVFITTMTLFFVFIISTAWLITFSKEYAEEYFLFSTVISILIALFTIYSIYSTFNIAAHEKREMETEKNKEITELYKNEIKTMYENMRDFKHDYMKIYSSMSLLIQQEKYDELKNFFIKI